MPHVDMTASFTAPPEFGKRCRALIDDFLRPDCRHMETGLAHDKHTGRKLLFIGCEGKPHVFNLPEAKILIKTLKAMKPKHDPVEGEAVRQLILRIKKAVHKMERKHFH